jgi:hypothetical protein
MEQALDFFTGKQAGGLACGRCEAKKEQTDEEKTERDVAFCIGLPG